MINTYSGNLPPPPVPPRYGTSRSAPNKTRSHLRWLSAAFVLQTVVSVALFIYLLERIETANNADNSMFQTDQIVLKRLTKCGSDSLDNESLLSCNKTFKLIQNLMSKVPQNEGRVDSLSAPDPQSGLEALAHMTIQQPSGDSSKILKWNRDHSRLKNVDFFRNLLQIRISGYYYIYSQVTFSKADSSTPKAQTVMRKRRLGTALGENLLFKAFCSLRSDELCTSYNGGVVRLEQGDQLYINVTDPTMVNYEVAATTFGLFLLNRNP
ncbi:hypothetical protein JZ751_022600 [Albula glossodonta]|uniref:THD domain-containing protein n=1 Tax=Albula glossodonta TaxID=121402 RepID=A0A8T2PM65_9TELE|nr:hypothetical protein JZ751_022600 [Albula glossodonta]